jgi:hypothetical protein
VSHTIASLALGLSSIHFLSGRAQREGERVRKKLVVVVLVWIFEFETEKGKESGQRIMAKNVGILAVDIYFPPTCIQQVITLSLSLSLSVFGWREKWGSGKKVYLKFFVFS